jgi:replication fork protection complex subunit Tof1/Swi1
MLFCKIPATLYYLEHGHDREVPRKTARPAAELELRPGVEKDKGIGALVALLHLDDQDDFPIWLKDTLEEAATERKSWEDKHFAALAAGDSENPAADENGQDSATRPSIGKSAPASQFQCHAKKLLVVHPKDEKTKKAMFKNGRLRLLMTLLGFERLGLDDDPNASWIIPSSVPSAQLYLDKETLDKAIEDPPMADEDGRVPEDFIRRKPTDFVDEPTERRTAGAFDDDSDGMDDFLDFGLFPAGGPTARKSDALEQLKKSRRKRNRVADELDDEAKAKRAEARRLADLEKRRKIKSDLFVHDSDDETDEERDELFFAKEDEGRKKTSQSISNAISSLHNLPATSEKKRKSTSATNAGKTKRRKTVGSGEESGAASAEENAIAISSDSSSSVPSDSDDAMEDVSDHGEKETPLSSEQVIPHDLEDRSSQPTSANKAIAVEREEKGLDSEDELPVQRPVRSRVRGGFVIESDSE